MLSTDIILMHIDNEEWKKKPSFLKESSIVGSYAPSIIPAEDIIRRLWQIDLKDMSLCTEKFGNFISEKYPKECISIIGTEIPSTMMLVTSIYSLPMSTQKSITKCLLMNKSKKKKNMLTVAGTLLKNGMEVRKEETGIKNMPRIHSNIPSAALNANCARSLSSQENKQIQDFVRINVKVSGEEKITLIMSLEYADFVISHSLSTSNLKPQPAPSHVEENNIGRPVQYPRNISDSDANIATVILKSTMPPKGSFALPHVLLNSGKKQNVYSLHVKDFHAYYVHNILTLNCMDSLRYALFTHFFERSGKRMQEEEADAMEKIWKMRS